MKPYIDGAEYPESFSPRAIRVWNKVMAFYENEKYVPNTILVSPKILAWLTEPEEVWTPGNKIKIR